MASYRALLVPGTGVDPQDDNKMGIYATAYIWDATTGQPYKWPAGVGICLPLSIGPVYINAFTDPSSQTWQALSAALKASQDAPVGDYTVKILGVPGRW